MAALSSLVLVLSVVLCYYQGNCQNYETCQRFQGGSCCPELTPIDREIENVLHDQPLYVTFLPRNEESVLIDNVCYTLFPVPDDSSTFLVYISRVYINGNSEIRTFLVSEPTPGVRKLGNGLCQFTDTAIAEIDCVDCGYPTYAYQRCQFFGDCPFADAFDTPSGVFGFSEIRRPISRACLNSAAAAARNIGLPEDDYYILPMKLPSRCVLNQVCTVASALNRFCQTVGVAFPTVNRCINQNYI